MMRRLRFTSRFPARGFALVVVLSMLVLLTILSVGLLSLSTIALRSSGQGGASVRARTNARLALMLALGDLQRHAGPDTRATAPASILNSEGIEHPHWTGVWSTRGSSGGPLFTRDDKAGGLSDTRATASDWEHLALSWLVSGAESGPALNPHKHLSDAFVKLVGPGTLGDGATNDEVSAPQVAVNTSPELRGNYAWWVGDLGIKANIATPDAFEGKVPDPAAPAAGGWFRLLTSQEADASTLADPAHLDASGKRRLASDYTPSLLSPQARAASGKHFHDFTSHSQGLLADMANGGLKRDLTAYFQSNGGIPDHNGLPGLSDQDNLVGPANASDPTATRDGVNWYDTRHQFTAPRFGLLRHWAATAAPFTNHSFDAVPPKPEPAPRTAVATDTALALANLTPASIAAADTPNISPILVEGSLFYNLSWYRLSSPPDKPAPVQLNQLRLHVYPRFVLWNPYNVNLTLDRCLGMIQGNGRQEMWVNAYLPLGDSRLNLQPMQWIWFEGGRSIDFVPPNGNSTILESAGYKDPYMGCWYFSIPRTTFAPGECLVFSPDKAAEYSRPLSPLDTNYALETNALTCLKPPHPSRSYYSSDDALGDGFRIIPTSFWFAPITSWGGITNQTDDCRVVLKRLGKRSHVTFEIFDGLPQLSLLSASLQFGSGREPRISWSKNEPMNFDDTTIDPPTSKPNVRTREGIRLRWFKESWSNEEASGSLKDTPHFEEALLATWNPRAAYITRSPYENIAGSMPVSGTLGGPWFFGAYTRDLYDGAVSWDDQMPVLRDGRYHGYPFGPPQEGGGKPIVLFDLPREGSGVLSIGQFQHAKLSEFVWHPSYAVGQSLADPRIATGRLSGLNHTSPLFLSSTETQQGGFDTPDIGWSSDVQRSDTQDAWAIQGRAIYQDYPVTDNLVYDLSFELNHTLWDAFFLSTGSNSAKQQFLADPARAPLPNGRMQLAPVTGPRPQPRTLPTSTAVPMPFASTAHSTSTPPASRPGKPCWAPPGGCPRTASPSSFPGSSRHRAARGPPPTLPRPTPRGPARARSALRKSTASPTPLWRKCASAGPSSRWPISSTGGSPTTKPGAWARSKPPSKPPN